MRSSKLHQNHLGEKSETKKKEDYECKGNSTKSLLLKRSSCSQSALEKQKKKSQMSIIGTEENNKKSKSIKKDGSKPVKKLKLSTQTQRKSQFIEGLDGKETPELKATRTFQYPDTLLCGSQSTPRLSIDLNNLQICRKSDLQEPRSSESQECNKRGRFADPIVQVRYREGYYFDELSKSPIRNFSLF